MGKDGANGRGTVTRTPFRHELAALRVRLGIAERLGRLGQRGGLGVGDLLELGAEVQTLSGRYWAISWRNTRLISSADAEASTCRSS